MDLPELLLLLFAAAYASLWVPPPHPRRMFSFGLMAAAGIPALAMGAITAIGLGWAGLLFGAGLYYRHDLAAVRLTAKGLFIALVLALGFGILPGFEPVTLYGAQVLKQGSAEYALRIRPDKVLAGFALLAFAVPLTRELSGWRQIARAAAPALAVTAPLVLGAGWLAGYVGFKPGAPTGAFVASWATVNLLFVAGVEEGFFRGLLQRGVSARFGNRLGLPVAAVLFGLAHFGGGPLYVLLAALAGLGYGAAYQLSGRRIEAAMLAHFGLNLLHLLLFTYPFAA
jgi:membrane protease YdiL (CAAX protease family)